MFSISKEAIQELCVNKNIDQLIKFHKEDWIKQFLKDKFITLDMYSNYSLDRLLELEMKIDWDNIDQILKNISDNETINLIVQKCPDIMIVKNMYEKDIFTDDIDSILRKHLCDFLFKNYNNYRERRNIYKIIETIGIYKAMKVCQDNIDHLLDIAHNFRDHEDIKDELVRFYDYCERNSKDDILLKFSLEGFEPFYSKYLSKKFNLQK